HLSPIIIHSTKVDVIKKLLSKNNITNHDECIMIGDRCFDVEGAKQVNISCIGVCFGFGSKEELEASGAIATADTPMDIAKILL
ncbi:MAG: HAD hydrolase-like protein, partial [Treponema sp.]|nr:HAD hydrolase-like protein [Treponema sp.]